MTTTTKPQPKSFHEAMMFYIMNVVVPKFVHENASPTSVAMHAMREEIFDGLARAIHKSSRRSSNEMVLWLADSYWRSLAFGDAPSMQEREGLDRQLLKTVPSADLEFWEPIFKGTVIGEEITQARRR